ncbi:hypothetical protein FTO74_17285 [Granulicella sp. WH15]|uniref:hypothetical protein n=1 Tax=Granulicella sp. WH15 TaxID=2602070 RepID=UPI001366AAAD|nr:hypothetical protein [Granulicella sp. WH15]QHN04919.1 hypothetical protein FTO74_17285 [Granulicella sp. WH15]
MQMTWTIFKDSLTLIVAATAAAFGLRTYAANATTRRAEFLVDLHRSFFVEDKYRKIREILDSETDEAKREQARLILDEPEEFIEFLNYFELVAYLCQCKNLLFDDVEALLGYYFRLLIHLEAVRKYIRNRPRNGFEHLDALLGKIEATGE